MPPSPNDDPRVRFAAEQNFLAWIRTGVALMGFGFVVARFGLFLHEMAVADPGHVKPHSTSWSMAFGVSLVLLGVVVNVVAGMEFRAVVGRFDRGEPYQPPRWSLGLVVAMVLSAIGLAMAGYILTA